MPLWSGEPAACTAAGASHWTRFVSGSALLLAGASADGWLSLTGQRYSLIDTNLAQWGELPLSSAAWFDRWPAALPRLGPLGVGLNLAAAAVALGIIGVVVLRSQRKAGSGRRLRQALAAVFFLCWVLPAVLVQRQPSYQLGTAVLLGFALLAAQTRFVSHRLAAFGAFAARALSPAVVARFIVPGALVCVLAAQPFFRPERLSLWPVCWQTASTLALRDRLALSDGDHWVELQEVSNYLKDQGVGDRELTCYSLASLPLYLDLDVEPSTRFVMLGVWLQFFPAKRELMLEELAASPQRYLVAARTDPLPRIHSSDDSRPGIALEGIAFRTEHFVVYRAHGASERTTDCKHSRECAVKIARAAVVGYYLAFAGAMAWLVPVFGMPDERAHLNYVNFVARTGSLPDQYDKARAVYWEGHQPPLYYAVAAALIGALKRDRTVDTAPVLNKRHKWAGGPSYEVPEYDHVYHSPFSTNADQIAFYVLRGLSILMGLGTLLVAEKLCRRLVGDPWWGLLGGLLIATLPQFAFISAAVNNDNAANFLAAAALYNLFALMDQPYRMRYYAVFGVCLGLGVLSKKTVLFLVPGAVFVLLYLVWKNRRAWQRLLCSAAMAACAAALISGWMFVRNYHLYGDWLGSRMEEETIGALSQRRHLLTTHFLGRIDVVEVWGPLAGLLGREVAAYVFPWYVLLLALGYLVLVYALFVTLRTRVKRFLPAAALYTAAVCVLTFVYSNYIFTGYSAGVFWGPVGESFVGRFGAMAVPLPVVCYGFYKVLAVVAGTGLFVHLVRQRFHDVKVLTALLLIGTAMTGFLHYNLSYPQPQGRLLFPALTLVSALTVLGFKTIADVIGGRTSRRWCAGLVVVGLIACDATALGQVSKYFYTPTQYGAQWKVDRHKRMSVRFDRRDEEFFG